MITTLQRFETFLLGEMPRLISQRVSNKIGIAGVKIDEAVVAEASRETVEEVFAKFMSTLSSPVQNLDHSRNSEAPSTTEATKRHGNNTSVAPSPFIPTSPFINLQTTSPWVFNNNNTDGGHPTQPMHAPCEYGGAFADPIMPRTSEGYVPGLCHDDNCWCSACQAFRRWSGPC